MLPLIRFRLSLQIVALSIAVACAGQDPFGDSGRVDQGGLFGAAPEATEQPTEDSADALTRHLIERAQAGGPALADSVSALARTGQWQSVDRLLVQAGSQPLSETDMTQMAQRLGPSMLVRLGQHPAVSDTARDLLTKIATAARRENESPARLTEALESMASGSLDERLRAARTLLGGGHAAIKVVVNSIVTRDAQAEARDEQLRVLSRLGDGGVSALRQLTLYGAPAVRTRALAALSRLDRPSLLADFATAYHATDASQAERMVAFQRAGQVSRREAAALLARQLRLRRAAAHAAPNDNDTATVWFVNQTRDGIQYRSVSQLLLRYRDAVDTAAQLRRVGDLSAAVYRQVVAANLAYQVMIDPDWGDDSQLQRFRADFPALSGADLAGLIEGALADGDVPVSLSALRLITPSLSPADQETLLFHGSPSALVQAASASQPQVRFEAALAIQRIAGERMLAGSSHVRRTLAEMSRLADQPRAILVETRPWIVQSLQQHLSRRGFAVTVVGSVGDLLQAVASAGDLQLIVCKTQLSDLPPDRDD